MNLTLALIAGLVLLLPGITALTVWNFLGGRNGAKRPELQLTSVAALFLALVVSFVMHLLGYALYQLGAAAAADVGAMLPTTLRSPLHPNPYDSVLLLAQGRSTVSASTLGLFGLLIFLECYFVWNLVGSEGLDLGLEGGDLRGQGWVFQHVVRPARHGFTPIAYVLTLPVQGEYGIGYEGVVADIRQGNDGEIKSISLAAPQRFIYRVKPVIPQRRGSEPSLDMSEREWLGGIVALDASVIRNIVVHNISPDVLAEVEAVGEPEAAS